MVRNTRLALACGLLTAITVAMLGSRPFNGPGAANLLPMPFAAGYALLRSEELKVAEEATPTSPMRPIAAPAGDTAPSLEGNRHPRGPRAGREASGRTSR